MCFARNSKNSAAEEPINQLSDRSINRFLLLWSTYKKRVPPPIYCLLFIGHLPTSQLPEKASVDSVDSCSVVQLFNCTSIFHRLVHIVSQIPKISIYRLIDSSTALQVRQIFPSTRALLSQRAIHQIHSIAAPGNRIVFVIRYARYCGFHGDIMAMNSSASCNVAKCGCPNPIRVSKLGFSGSAA